MFREPPKPRIQLPSQRARPGMVPGDCYIPVPRIWLLLLFQLTGLAGSEVVSKTHSHTHTHTGVPEVAGGTGCCTHKGQHGQHNLSVMLPKLREGHTAPVLFLLSRKSECKFTGEKMCALILHIQKTQTCIVSLNVSTASRPVKYPCLGALAVV